jgi:hypothetical protein
LEVSDVDTYLATMHQYVLPTPKGLVNIIACSLEVRFEINSGLIEYANAIALEHVFVKTGETWYLEDLNEVGDVMLMKKVLVVDRGHGAEVKGARCCTRAGR